MINSYDYLPENNGILLDLPFYEGTGTFTRDQAKPHHQDVLLVNAPTWDSGLNDPTYADGSLVLFSSTGAAITVYYADGSFYTVHEYGVLSIGVLTSDGLSSQYIELDNAASADLDFQGGDYSLACWFNWTDTGTSLNVMGRYELNVSGWELYLFAGLGGQNYLTLRHHHAGTLVGGNPRSACNSENWTPEVWWFMGISRTGGGEAIHYRNGAALTMATGGLVDPETSASDSVIGARYTKNADWYKGSLWRPRIWNRALAASEWESIFEKERDFFGV